MAAIDDWNRREILARIGAGFGLVGLSGALAAAADAPAAGAAAPHPVARAKRVIFLFMNGGPSQVDTFDPKPKLRDCAGQQPPVGKFLKSAGTGFMPSPFAFARHGQSGVEMSELFPNLARHADDLCVIRSMHTDVPNHEPGLLLMHSGNLQPIRPSMGSWISYGLGAINENLPAFVVLSPGMPVVGPQLWSSSFLPGQHQGTCVDTRDLAVNKLVANLEHPTLSRPQLRQQLDLLRAFNERHLAQRGGDEALEAQIKSMELAFQMQREAGEAFDLSLEREEIRDAYGRTPFGQSCLLARRLAERGVRFIQVYHVDGGSTTQQRQPWDAHGHNDRAHRRLGADSDRATAALLGDLKQRGLLDDTLVVWGGEFGRTPYAQTMAGGKVMKEPGRDHHHTGFSMFLAGGGVRGGLTHGATDELGLEAIADRVHVHDLHATILHLLGIDHTRLTFRYSGRDFRLTDVHGHVVHDILA